MTADVALVSVGCHPLTTLINKLLYAIIAISGYLSMDGLVTTVKFFEYTILDLEIPVITG